MRPGIEEEALECEQDVPVIGFVFFLCRRWPGRLTQYQPPPPLHSSDSASTALSFLPHPPFTSQTCTQIAYSTPALEEVINEVTRPISSQDWASPGQTEDSRPHKTSKLSSSMLLCLDLQLLLTPCSSLLSLSSWLLPYLPPCSSSSPVSSCSSVAPSWFSRPWRIPSLFCAGYWDMMA